MDEPEAAALEFLAAQVHQVLGITIRGLLVSAPGVDPLLLLRVIAQEAGDVLAGALKADLPTLLRVRGDLKAAFADGVGKAHLAQTTSAPMESLKRRLGG